MVASDTNTCSHAGPTLHEADLGAEALDQVGRDVAAVDGLEELGGPQRGADLPAHPRGRVSRHLVHGPGRDVELRAGVVALLVAVAEDHPHRALEDLEVLVLARMQVLGRGLAGPAVVGLHHEQFRLDADELQHVAVLPMELLARVRHQADLDRRASQSAAVAAYALTPLRRLWSPST